MVPPLIDLAAYDLSSTVFPKEEILKALPQRSEFEQIDSICAIDIENQVIIGRRHIRDDEFWIRGHVPGMPLFPGVLMIEAAGQLSAILYKHLVPEIAERFIAFAGVERARFRGTLRPGDDVILVGKGVLADRRISKCAVQGLLDGKVVFECTVVGMALPDRK